MFCTRKNNDDVGSLDLAEIKHQLESTLGKEEFERKISRQRSQLSESQSHHSDLVESGTAASPVRSLSRYAQHSSPSVIYTIYLVIFRRSGSIHSVEKSGGSIRRRSSAKDRSKSVDGEARPPAPPANKLIEAEKSETGKV